MKSSDHWLGRLMAVLLISLLASPASHSNSAAAQQVPPGGTQAAASAPGPANATSTQQPAGLNVAESALPENPAPANPKAPAQEQQPATPQSTPPAPPDNSHRPVGTAAAPYEPTTGIAASRPAGAAIAPAKQRRVRTFLISLGIIAGAGIAVGSVAALSHGSPSRP